MIVLDTDVVLMRSAPDPAVAAWARAQPGEQVHTSAFTVAEVGYGIARLPAGRRREALAAAAAGVFAAFAGRVLAFDVAAAGLYGQVVTTRERAGTPISAMDALIAAVAMSRAAVLATRNTADFTGLDLELVDPWSVGTAGPQVGT